MKKPVKLSDFKERNVRKKEPKVLVCLSEINLTAFEKLFENASNEVKNQIVKVKWGRGGKRATYFSTYRKYLGLFDRIAYIDFINYFVENHNMRQTSFSYRRFIKENYFKNEKQNTGVFNVDLEVKNDKSKDFIQLTDEAIYRIADIREKYIKELYGFIYEKTNVKREYFIPTEKITY